MSLELESSEVASDSLSHETHKASNHRLLVVSLCGAATETTSADCSLVLRFAVADHGLEKYELSALQREAEIIAPHLCKQLYDSGIEPPRRLGEISFVALQQLQSIVCQCAAGWNPVLQLCGNMAEEKTASKQRMGLRTAVRQEIMLYRILQKQSQKAVSPDSQIASRRQPIASLMSSSKFQARLTKVVQNHDHLHRDWKDLVNALVKVHSELLELTTCLTKERLCSEEHRYALHRQFVIFAEAITEKEAVPAQLHEELTASSDTVRDSQNSTTLKQFTIHSDDEEDEKKSLVDDVPSDSADLEKTLEPKAHCVLQSSPTVHDLFPAHMIKITPLLQMPAIRDQTVRDVFAIYKQTSPRNGGCSHSRASHAEPSPKISSKSFPIASNGQRLDRVQQSLQAKPPSSPRNVGKKRPCLAKRHLHDTS